jgi:hypothetical protein
MPPNSAADRVRALRGAVGTGVIDDQHVTLRNDLASVRSISFHVEYLVIRGQDHESAHPGILLTFL